MTPVSSPSAATFQQQSQPNQSPHSSQRIKPSKLPLQSVRPASTLTLLKEEDVMEEEEEEVERVDAEVEAMADAHEVSLEHFR